MQKFDLHINDFNFITGMLAFAALKNGLSVSIEVSKAQLATEFLPEPSAYYPFHLRQIPHALKVEKWIHSIRTLFPHLFYPVRSVGLFAHVEPKASYIAFVDKIMSRDREESTFPFNISKYESYSALNKQLYSKGILAFEIRFDRNRAIVELLKMCKENGAVINQCGAGRLVIESSAFSVDQRLIDLNENTPFENQLNVQQGETCISIFKIRGKCAIYLHRYSSKEKVNELLTSLGLKTKIEILDQTSHYKKGINDVSLMDFPKEYMKLEKSVSMALGRNIDLRKALPEAASDFTFKQAHESCDDHYNLAKQTGIDVLDFSYYFFRYPNQIDWMIERAYELMSSQRNPRILWPTIEQEIIKKERDWLL